MAASHLGSPLNFLLELRCLLADRIEKRRLIKKAIDIAVLRPVYRDLQCLSLPLMNDIYSLPK